MQVVPLHNHSEYSNVPTLDGFATTKEIVARIKEIGSEHIGLTDHAVVAGHFDFEKTCVEAGIHPVFGIETYQARTTVDERHRDSLTDKPDRKHDSFHLILLAQNNTGLKNVWRMSSLAYTTGFYGKPRVDWKMLEENSEGVIATSACMSGYVSWDIEHERTGALERYLKIFGDRFYIELHTYDSEKQRDLNVELVRLSKKFGIPVVYATDAHYACCEDYHSHDAMLAVREKKKIDDPTRRMHHSTPSLWIAGEEDIRKSLNYLPSSVVDEAITNSLAIAESCVAELPKPKNRVPKYHAIPEGKSNKSLLIDLVKRGAEDRGVSQKPEYLERAKKELEVILSEDHLINYFLIQQDIVNYCKSNEILIGPGRGSVGGSLVAYLLKIIDIDPLQYGLIFERFYNAGRAKGGLPDIDIDFPTNKRTEVKEYIAENYGKENIASIGTIMRLKAKSTIDKVQMVMPVDGREVVKLKNICDEYTDAGLLASWETIKEDSRVQAFADKHPEFIELVDKLHGRIFTSGIHASGFLIADEPLAGTFPLKYSSKNDEVSTQFDMHEAERMGFMKNDMLGLTKLDTLIEFKKILKEKYNMVFHVEQMHNIKDVEAHKNNPVWELLRKGLTIGIFQLEDGAQARQITKDIAPKSIEDLAVIFALNRPGPVRSGAVTNYIKRRNGEEYEIYPGLEEILGETYGLFVYQEQVIRLMTMLGFSLEEADNVRRIMGKKKPEEMAKLQPEYLEKAAPIFGKEVAYKIWDDILDFSKYGFNKSHAVGYAVLAYWGLIAKATYPLEFLLASIRTDPDNVHLYIAEARRMGFEVTPPDINLSESETNIVDGKIIYGLKDVKGVKGDAQWVMDNRPFKSRKDLEDRLNEQNKQFLKDKKAGLVPEGTRSPKQLFSLGKINALYDAGAFDSIEERDISLTEKRELEKEYFGIVLTNNAPIIIEKNLPKIEKACIPIGLLDANTIPGDEVLTYGYISERTDSKTKDGQPMARFTVEYGSESINLVAFSKTLRDYDHVLKEYVPAIFMVRKNTRGLAITQARILR
jgi:DNA polymerase III subunit alpha